MLFNIRETPDNIIAAAYHLKMQSIYFTVPVVYSAAYWLCLFGCWLRSDDPSPKKIMQH